MSDNNSIVETHNIDEKDEDPEVTVAKFMAYRRAQHRNRKMAHLITWLLALPVAWLAWKFQAYHLVMDWMSISPSDGERVRLLMEIVTVAGTWMITVNLQFPLRLYLRARWEVDPKRFGISSTEQS